LGCEHTAKGPKLQGTALNQFTPVFSVSSVPQWCANMRNEANWGESQV